MEKPSAIRVFLDSPRGSVLMSVILGLGLATMFRKACRGAGCTVVRGPPLKELRRHVYIQDGQCYKYTPVATSCRA